jgi:hypothetical protein
MIFSKNNNGCEIQSEPAGFRQPGPVYSVLFICHLFPSIYSYVLDFFFSKIDYGIVKNGGHVSPVNSRILAGLLLGTMIGLLTAIMVLD